MRTLLISLMAVGLFAASSCVNEGGQVFGELPEGVVPVSGEALEARGAVYNKDLNELKISWRTTPDPKLYKGVEVSFQALGGQSKTIRSSMNMFDKDDVGGEKNTWKRFQMGWQIGVGLDYNKLHVGLGYTKDFMELSKKLKTSSVLVSLGYNF